METSRSEMFRKLLERDPNNPMILYSLGNELFKEKKYSEAWTYLSQAIENKPDYSVAYRVLGRALYEVGENDEARRVFTEGREVARKNGDLQTVKASSWTTRVRSRARWRGRFGEDSPRRLFAPGTPGRRLFGRVCRRQGERRS